MELDHEELPYPARVWISFKRTGNPKLVTIFN